MVLVVIAPGDRLRRVAFVEQQRGQVQESGHVQHHRRADDEHALLRGVAVVLRVDVDAGGQAVAAHRAHGELHAGDLADVEGVAEHAVHLLRTGVAGDAAARVVVVGLQEVDVDERAAVLVAGDVGEGEDRLLDVGARTVGVVVVRLGERGAVAKAQRGVAPVGRLHHRGERETGECTDRDGAKAGPAREWGLSFHGAPHWLGGSTFAAQCVPDCRQSGMQDGVAARC